MSIRRFLVLGLMIAGAVSARGDEPTPSFAVVSYNIRYANSGDGEDIWDNRKEAVADYLGNPDIIGLQEVTETQYAYLREHLTSFETYGVGRDDGKSKGEHSPIFYRRDRFESLDEGTFWLSENPEAVGSKDWDAAITRICSWIHLRDRKSGKEFYIGNTHFDHRGALAREKSGELIATRIDALPDDAPVILVGDFNCQADSKPYQAITAAVEDARVVSVTPPEGPDSTWSGFQQIAPGRIIDHVFVRGVAVESLRVDNPKTTGGRFASDHLPVRAVVRVR